MTKFAPLKVVTKRIKAELQQAHPAVKFSVRQSASGRSIVIQWQDGPVTKTIDALVKRYQAGNFNGMIDLYEYKPDSELVVIDGLEYSAQYVMCERQMSPATEGELVAWAHSYYDLGPDAQPWDYERMAWQRFCQTTY